MNAQPFQTFLLDILRQAQSRQNTFFQELLPGEMAIIGEPDSWSAKDHVAHLTEKNAPQAAEDLSHAVRRVSRGL